MKKRNTPKKNPLRKAFLFVKDSKDYIYISIILFFIFLILGFLNAPYLSFMDNILKELFEKTKDLGLKELTLFIFLNNLKSAFFSIILGIIFGIFPIINSIMNGLILGYVLAKSWAISGISDFWRILPHGIFELPAIFISLGIGLRLGISTLKNLIVLGKEKLKPSSKKTTLKKEKLSSELISAFYTFVLIILPLLVIAAIIESIFISIYK